MKGLDELTPRQIVAELDKYIVGQERAKRAVAIAIRNRYRRLKLPSEVREDVIPKNILMIGPTGVGKTEIARRLAQLMKAPFVKVEATKYTEVGYVGRDVDSMVRDLVEVAVRMVQAERMEEVEERAYELALGRLVDYMLRSYKPSRPSVSPLDFLFSGMTGRPAQEAQQSLPPDPDEVRRRRELRARIKTGEMDETEVEIEVEEVVKPPVIEVFGAGSIEEMGVNIQEMLGPFFPKRKKPRQVKVREAMEILSREEAQKLVDMEQVTREAIRRAEQMGIIFIDEIDKIAGRETPGRGPDVSREGVQRDMLPVVEGTTVMTKYGPVRTHHILFIAAGAFHATKPSDLIPELQGRFPIRVELDPLTVGDLKRILVEPKNSLVKQYKALLATEGMELDFTEEAIEEVAEIAAEINNRTENIGARRLHTVMERLLEEVSFGAPELSGKQVVIDANYVREKLGDIIKDYDLTRYIL